MVSGTLPCDVIFVGEAPGFSEDTLGRPFVGPAGDLLKEIIQDAEDESQPVTKAYTNLVACVPIDPETGNKVTEPQADWIKACSERLDQIVEIANPKAIVMVGRLSVKWSPQVIDRDFECSAAIIHPAALLRMDPSQKPLAIQRATVILRDLFDLL